MEVNFFAISSAEFVVSDLNNVPLFNCALNTMAQCLCASVCEPLESPMERREERNSLLKYFQKKGTTEIA